MKNIHVLPTDKPSMWYLDENKKLQHIPAVQHNCKSCVNIYITSDEEIKTGDWSFDIRGFIEKVDETYDLEVINALGKKIILTTDQDLIKDGIQEIPDDFLEWFVSKANDSGVPIDIVEVVNDIPYKPYPYEIIIQKEEQKQHLIDMMKDDEDLGLYDYGWCKGNVVLPKEYPGEYDETQAKQVSQLAKEINPEDIFNDEKREGVKRVINQHKVLKGLSLINPLHLQMTSDGHGEFPDSYKLTEKGIQYIIEQFEKK